jgi:hypothetical protein
LKLIPREVAHEDNLLKNRVGILAISAINTGICLEHDPNLGRKTNLTDFYREYYTVVKKALGDNHILTRRLEKYYARSDMVLSSEL